MSNFSLKVIQFIMLVLQINSVSFIYLWISGITIEMHTGMDYLYRREAGFYPFKICETTSDCYLSFKDLQVASV